MIHAVKFIRIDKVSSKQETALTFSNIHICVDFVYLYNLKDNIFYLFACFTHRKSFRFE